MGSGPHGRFVSLAMRRSGEHDFGHGRRRVTSNSGAGPDAWVIVSVDGRNQVGASPRWAPPAGQPLYDEPIGLVARRDLSRTVGITTVTAAASTPRPKHSSATSTGPCPRCSAPSPGGSTTTWHTRKGQLINAGDCRLPRPPAARPSRRTSPARLRSPPTARRRRWPRPGEGGQPPRFGQARAVHPSDADRPNRVDPPPAELAEWAASLTQGREVCVAAGPVMSRVVEEFDHTLEEFDHAAEDADSRHAASHEGTT
jgi:hypothetical protein